MPRIEFDFADFGREEDQVLPIPSLNAVDVGSESLSATLCPAKALSKYLVETILAFVEALGHNVVKLHSDQEPVLVQLLKAVQSRRVERTLVRHGPRASHQSQGKIENANRVINGVCRAMWLSLEDLLRENYQATARSMVLAEISSEKQRQNCVCACFWESVHEPSVAIGRKSDVQVHEHIILTENGVRKARSLHRVPPEQRFVLSDLCEAWCDAWLQWLCWFGTTHRRLSSAIGKGSGRRESRSC